MHVCRYVYLFPLCFGQLCSCEHVCTCARVQARTLVLAQHCFCEHVCDHVNLLPMFWRCTVCASTCARVQARALVLAQHGCYYPNHGPTTREPAMEAWSQKLQPVHNRKFEIFNRYRNKKRISWLCRCSLKISHLRSVSQMCICLFVNIELYLHTIFPFYFCELQLSESRQF